LDFSKDKILMGAERKSATITPEGARLTAYHEGGHALVAMKVRYQIFALLDHKISHLLFVKHHNKD
jgi:ATP-dependent Zn protease